MGVTIDLTNTKRRVSIAEFALKMNISEQKLYAIIEDGRVKQPLKNVRKNFCLNSYVLECIIKPDCDDLDSLDT